MNYFERCKKRIEDYKHTVSLYGDNSDIVVEDIVLSKIKCVHSFHVVRFRSIVVPLDENEAETLYDLARQIYIEHREILEKEILKDL